MGRDPDSGAYAQIGRNHHKFRNTQREYFVQEATQVADQFLGNNSFFLSLLFPYRRIQIRSATPVDSMNEGGMLRAVDQQLSVHSKR